jgi:hypothetical protein
MKKLIVLCFTLILVSCLPKANSWSNESSSNFDLLIERKDALVDELQDDLLIELTDQLRAWHCPLYIDRRICFGANFVFCEIDPFLDI